MESHAAHEHPHDHQLHQDLEALKHELAEAEERVADLKGRIEAIELQLRFESEGVTRDEPSGFKVG